MRHVPFGMDFFKQVNLSECHARVMGLSPAKRGIGLQTSLEIVFDVVIGFGGMSSRKTFIALAST